MLMSKTRIHQSGFSLVEVMVAAGLVGIVAVGTIQLMGNLSEGQRTMMQAMNIQELQSIVTNAIRDRQGCMNSLARFTPGGTTNIPTAPVATGTEVRNNANGIVLQAGDEIGTGGGRIRIVDAQFYTQVPPPIVDSGARSAIYRIRYNKIDRSNNFTATDWVKDFTITIIPVDITPPVGVPPFDFRISNCYYYDSTTCGALGGTVDLNTGRCNQICDAGGNCRTVFNQRRCPDTGYPLHFTMMIGMSVGGTAICAPPVICGAPKVNNGTWQVCCPQPDPAAGPYPDTWQCP